MIIPTGRYASTRNSKPIISLHGNSQTSKLISLPAGGDYEVHVLPGNTSFVPTHYGFDPSVKAEYLDPNHTAHDMFQGVPSYGWLPDSSQYNNDVPSETTIDFAPLQTVVTFFWGIFFSFLESGKGSMANWF
jgi:hypothetical protein